MLKADLIQVKTVMEQKLNYIIDLLECCARVADPARRAAPSVQLFPEAAPSQPAAAGVAVVAAVEVEEPEEGTDRSRRRRRSSDA